MAPSKHQENAPESMKKLFAYIDDQRENLIQNLAQAVEIKSVSAWPENRGEIVKMIHWAGDRLKGFGATVEYCPLGMQTLPDGKQIELPPVLMGELGQDPEKKTVLLYGHLDVQPALKEDGWDYEPFVLTRDSGKLYGRGASDDKGPVLGWLHAIQAYQALKMELPVNLKFCFEGMEESGSEGLDDLLAKKKDTEFMQKVDYVCISDNYWLGKEKPCITYGLRGICYFFMEISCCAKDLHSGVFGGTVHEAMADLMHMMNTLIDKEPWSITETLRLVVSIKRINKFFESKELDPTPLKLGRQNTHLKYSVEIRNGSFGWEDPTVATPILKDINIAIPQGSLVAVIGQVGSGKSTLLSAILGETERFEGEVLVNGNTIAYVSQEPWIQNISVKNNITFSQDKPDENWYKKVVEACSLEQDLKQLMDGDQTLIGEKGINLSGGQKQRVSIARAAYSKADLYLMDDPLSALDSQTANHVFEEVMSNSGILRHSTRILTTHNTSVLNKADFIAVLKDGQLVEFGPPTKVMTSSSELSRLVEHFEEREDESKTENPEENTNKFEKLRKPVAKDKKETALAQRLKDEEVLTGRVKSRAYQKYLGALGAPICVLILGLFMANQAISTSSTVWLAAWSDHNSQLANHSQTNSNTSLTVEKDPDNGYYIGVLAAFGVAQAILSFLRNLVFYLACARGSKIIHNSLFDVIIRAKTRFFDTTPTGSIINRFSADMNTVDQPLPNALSSFLFTLMEVTSVLIVISISTPIFMVIILPLVIVYVCLIRVYIPSSRQLQRFGSSTKSPINLHFSETIQGISTIRAFQHENMFTDEFESRVQENLRFQYASVMATRWLSLRSEALGNIVVLVAALVAVGQRSALTAGWVGLSITYALSITETFNWVLQNGCKLEEQAVNLERIRETEENAPVERPWRNPEVDPKDRRWVKRGDIQFHNLTLSYDEDLDPVLKGVNLTIKSGEKVGVCGRTGAGKSSLAVALLNLVDSWTGQMLLDGVEVRALGLHTLRSQITMIPQDPVMFKGTIRQNIDPFNKYKDDFIWTSLTNCRMDIHIRNFAAGLEHKVEEGGSNFSVGQKQLICLARALLKDNTIVFLDEATASMDAETDQSIQETLFRELEGKTLITIAHRLNTVLNYDKILVLDEGKVVEFDTPQALLEDECSQFYSMIHESS